MSALSLYALMLLAAFINWLAGESEHAAIFNIAILILLWCVASEMSYQDEIAAQIVMVGR